MPLNGEADFLGWMIAGDLLWQSHPGCKNLGYRQMSRIGSPSDVRAYSREPASRFLG